MVLQGRIVTRWKFTGKTIWASDFCQEKMEKSNISGGIKWGRSYSWTFFWGVKYGELHPEMGILTCPKMMMFTSKICGFHRGY